MDREVFLEQLLAVMERKDHWAWPAFTSGLVPKERLHIHFEQEYATYVRDFPVMVGWAYVQCPVAEVRRKLAENLYEEETGALVAGRPHPELFLEYPKGLGMDLSRFSDVKLLPAAENYRAFLDDAIQKRGWEIATAIVTLFIEGTKDDRIVVENGAARSAPAPLAEHPLVKHYDLPLEHLALTKAHQQVEGDHRAAAWKAVLDFVGKQERRPVVAAMKQALAHWLSYRDEVAAACGIVRGPDGRPRLASGRRSLLR
ncbi:MAG TPA: iron-containing redox enzyme family protein [Candidatus Acidoferrales bacterium]|nr:iron-containing redox enzyme family protein [Candidatus Acidoferrales bacterium]